MYALPNGMNFARLGLIIGKRGVPLAVNRNRLKRIARSEFRQCGARLCPYDIVIQMRADLSNERLREILSKVMLIVETRKEDHVDSHDKD